MHVVLKSDAEVLDEVVVTALGMKRSEKTLGICSNYNEVGRYRWKNQVL